MSPIGARCRLRPDFVWTPFRLDPASDLRAPCGCLVNKVEGLAIFDDGTAWASTDNDGVDDSSDETFFWSLGQF